MLKAQGHQIVGFEASLDRAHEQIPKLCAEPSGGEGGMHMVGPVRGLALARSVTGEELSQDDVLLGPAEQPGAGAPPQRGALTQYAETERLVGAGQRFGRGAADPGGNAVSQIRGRSPRSRQDQALVWRDPVTADPVDHDLDGGERLARARSTQDAQHRSGGGAVGGGAMVDGVMGGGAMGDGCSLCIVPDGDLGTQAGSPSQCQHRQIPSRRTDSHGAKVAPPTALARRLAYLLWRDLHRTHECPDREAGADALQNRFE
jgi:hypothetical protein